MKKILLIISVLSAIILGVSGCNASANTKKTEKLVIAYQWGLAYAPLEVIKEKKLIEKHYNGEIEIEWKTMNGSSEMYEGIVAGSVDVAHSGIGPFLTNTSKGVPCKMYSALSAQPMGLNTSKQEINSLKDFKPDDKIAVVSWGSIQHIMLSMAAEKYLGDAHALDHNIVNMSHPDGMQALLSGSVPAQLTTPPYYFMELETEGIHEIKEVAEAFPKDATIILGAASNKLYEERREVYDALIAAMEDAMEFLNENPNESAQLLCDKEGITAEKMQTYLTADGVLYSMRPSGVLEIADFMGRAGFLEYAQTSYEEICFPEVLEKIKK